MTQVAAEIESPVKTASVSLWTLERLTLVVFAIALALLMYVQGNLFLPSFDEGLNLEGAARLLQGQRPYVDFFGHASPGAYLYQALVFRLAGQSIWTARVLVLGYQSLQIALLFWMVAKFASRQAAWCAVFIYSSIQTADALQLAAHHRWDSSTLGLLSILLALNARSRPWILVSGLAAAAAVIATPTAALMGFATGGFLLFTGRRREFVAFASGVALALGAVGVWMVSNGMWTGGRFGGYLGFLRFMKENYAEPNATSFGFVQGGWLGLFEGSTAVEFLIRVPLVICLSLPIWAPLVAVGAWSWWAGRGDVAPMPRGAAWYLVACQVAMLIYPFPRADLAHLAYTSAFAFALVAIWMVHKIPARVTQGATMFLMFWSLAFLYQRVITVRSTTPVTTPIGTIQASGLHKNDVQVLLANIKPGDTMFVYPFMPTLTFLTQSRNPTASMFIQPGMMKDREELALLDDLRGTRPHWIVWFPWTRELFVRVFPGAANLPHRFPRIDEFVEANYVLRFQSPDLKFNLMELRTGATLP